VVNVNQRDSIIQAIQRLIGVLSSSEIAIDEKHTPKLYARFLKSLLSEQLVENEDSHEGPSSDSPRGRQRTTSIAGGSSTESDNKTQKPNSQTPPSQQLGSTEQHTPDTPSISLEYAPIGGEPHVQVLQDSLGRRPIEINFDESLPGFVPNYVERFSTTPSTVGGHDEDEDTLTQHGDASRMQSQLMNGQLSQNEMLASMRLLSNPQFFNHMMMPPYNPATWGQTPIELGVHDHQRADVHRTTGDVVQQVYPADPSLSYSFDQDRYLESM
jgi:hypothetical protein